MSDVGDLLELLHGAHDRWRTLQCSMWHWHHTARSAAAHERVLRTAPGAVWQQYVSEDACWRPETIENDVRLWIAKPDRFRREDVHGTWVGRGGLWWSWSSAMGFMSNEEEPEVSWSDPVQSYASHLDPAVLIPQFDVLAIDGTRARVRPRDRAQFGPGLPNGADEHELQVDERGIVVRLASFVDGEPFVVSELRDPVWDAEISDDVFTLAVPEGEEVLSPASLHGHNLTVDEAAERAAFAVSRSPSSRKARGAPRAIMFERIVRGRSS